MEQKKSTYILGLNFAYHELAACLIKDGHLIAAVEEERFSRVKRGKKALIDNPHMLPKSAIQYCLEVGKIGWKEIDYIGLSFYPQGRLINIDSDKYSSDGDWGSEKGERLFYKKIMTVPSQLNKLAGYDVSKKVQWIPHLICHASSAFFISPFKEAAILSIDGIGEFSSTWFGIGKSNAIHVIKEINYPNSLGFLWEKISKYLGFTEYDSSKVMGLSAYGTLDRFYKNFQKIVRLLPEGVFETDNDILRFRIEDYSQLEELFGVKKINSPREISKDQRDIAATLQKITDEVILHLARYLKKEAGSKNLCLAGGVALNCVSNGFLLQHSTFQHLYVQPAANDAGTALGSAYYIWHQILKQRRNFAMNHAYWGPEYSEKEILSALKRAKVEYRKVHDIGVEVAQRLADGNIIGWFQGRVEWGPRALGNRSLLADPRRKAMKDILNERIKKREPFRPFAPSVLKEFAPQWFIVPRKGDSISTEFMEINFDVKKSKQKMIPAVTHKDGTSRVQLVNKKTNPLYHKMITAFYEITGVPLVLNTSFNDNEPIVCSPDDALNTFMRTKMDFLAIGNYLISKKSP